MDFAFVWSDANIVLVNNTGLGSERNFMKLPLLYIYPFEYYMHLWDLDNLGTNLLFSKIIIKPKVKLKNNLQDQPTISDYEMVMENSPANTTSITTYYQTTDIRNISAYYMIKNAVHV